MVLQLADADGRSRPACDTDLVLVIMATEPCTGSRHVIAVLFCLDPFFPEVLVQFHNLKPSANECVVDGAIDGCVRAAETQPAYLNGAACGFGRFRGCVAARESFLQ